MQALGILRKIAGVFRRKPPMRLPYVRPDCMQADGDADDAALPGEALATGYVGSDRLSSAGSVMAALECRKSRAARE